jgi:hypothetical protein
LIDIVMVDAVFSDLVAVIAGIDVYDVGHEFGVCAGQANGSS